MASGCISQHIPQHTHEPLAELFRQLLGTHTKTWQRCILEFFQLLYMRSLIPAYLGQSSRSRHGRWQKGTQGLDVEIVYYFGYTLQVGKK